MQPTSVQVSFLHDSCPMDGEGKEHGRCANWLFSVESQEKGRMAVASWRRAVSFVFNFTVCNSRQEPKHHLLRVYILIVSLIGVAVTIFSVIQLNYWLMPKSYSCRSQVTCGSLNTVSCVGWMDNKCIHTLTIIIRHFTPV